MDLDGDIDEETSFNDIDGLLLRRLEMSLMQMEYMKG